MPGNGSASNSTVWQEKLAQYCSSAGWQSPAWQMVSDRRGGRTAWSSTVTIAGATVLARYWYDGNHANNAKEDAAEVALIQLSAIDASSNQSSEAAGRVA